MFFANDFPARIVIAAAANMRRPSRHHTALATTGQTNRETIDPPQSAFPRGLLFPIVVDALDQSLAVRGDVRLARYRALFAQQIGVKQLIDSRMALQLSHPLGDS